MMQTVTSCFIISSIIAPEQYDLPPPVMDRMQTCRWTSLLMSSSTLMSWPDSRPRYAPVLLSSSMPMMSVIISSLALKTGTPAFSGVLGTWSRLAVVPVADDGDGSDLLLIYRHRCAVLETGDALDREVRPPLDLRGLAQDPADLLMVDLDIVHLIEFTCDEPVEPESADVAVDEPYLFQPLIGFLLDRLGFLLRLRLGVSLRGAVFLHRFRPVGG